MILSLQGCMAVGKTTAARYIEEFAPHISVFYEDNMGVIAEVRRLGLDQRHFEDFIKIQRLFIENEIRRYEKALSFPVSLFDFGAEEIEFFTLSYPKSIGQDWNVEEPLRDELSSLSLCMPKRILFLNADESIISLRKINDNTRKRSSFEHHLKNLLPLKKQWFGGRDNVDFLDVTCLSPDEVGQKVLKWCNSFIK